MVSEPARPTPISIGLATPPRMNNLPVPPDALIGRERELAAARDLLARPDIRLVTVTGAGGAGKTRLALAFAAELAERFEAGVCFVPLAAIADPGFVAGAIAQTLDVRESQRTPLVEALTAALQPRHLLLVLDNFEQVVDAAPLVAGLLAACADLKVLVTSRAPLRVRGEHEFPAPPLDVPAAEGTATAEELRQSASVRLFVTRARAVRPDFTLTDENVEAVAEVCRRLDGLPLALELAAARVKVLTPLAMLPRLEHCLTLLTGGGRDLPARQQTLRATLDWSHELLAERERVVLRRLAVFAGGWTLAVAEAVCAGAGIDSTAVLDSLTALVDHSLVVAEERYGEARYRMLETVRAYAAERLAESGEGERVRERHAAAFLEFAEIADDWSTPRGRERWPRLPAEYDNIRAALTWCRAAGRGAWGLRLAAALWFSWLTNGRFAEGRGWLDGALAHCTVDDPDERAAAARPLALCGVGALGSLLLDYGAARTALEAALPLAEALPPQAAPSAGRSIAMTCFFLGIVEFDVGDSARARALFARAVAVAREGRIGWWHASALAYLGDATIEMDPVAARAHFEENLALCRAWGVADMSTFALEGLSRLAVQEGDLDAACTRAEEALAIRRSVGGRPSLEMSIATLAEALVCAGRHERAAALAEECLAVSRAASDAETAARALLLLGHAALARGDRVSAATWFAESLHRAVETGHPRRLAAALTSIAEHAITAAVPERGVNLLGAAAALLNTRGARLDPADQRHRERAAAAARAALGDGAFDQALAAGHLLTMEAAVAEALALAAVLPPATAGARDDAPRTVAAPDALTAREVEVVRLIAAGKSNAEIANDLVLSIRTVERHISTIYGKLGAHGGAARAIVVNYALTHHLLDA